MPLNVLVVDDSAVMRRMITKTLRISGLPAGEIHEAANGLEGIEALGAHRIDLVLVDIHMPVMGGQEMVERVRANPAWRDLPMMIVSSDGSPARVARSREQRTGFVQKPFSPESLRDRILELVGAGNEELPGDPSPGGDGPGF